MPSLCLAAYSMSATITIHCATCQSRIVCINCHTDISCLPFSDPSLQEAILLKIHYERIASFQVNVSPLFPYSFDIDPAIALFNHRVARGDCKDVCALKRYDEGKKRWKEGD